MGAEEAPTLTGLDWTVIVAATVCLVVLVVWAFQSQQHNPPNPEAA